ncbi:MFS transporter [Blautia sp. AM22-22LB]|nr:MFS transporter [Blautia sp. AM16-16B]RHO05261.1 MFS transporter [Blautia sp. AM22-22LB]
MKQNSKKNYVITSLALYFTYFIHGIGASILGLYKPQFAKAWGAVVGSDGVVDVSRVVAVIAALGLGRLISLPFSGPISDKFGRRLSGIIGVICYGIFFFGIAFSPSMQIAYVFAIIGGIANSFLDTCVSPTCMEIYVNNPSIANMFTKFSMCISQFLLPFMIGMVAAANMSYRTIFLVAGVAILIDGILILLLPFPQRGENGGEKQEKKKKQKVKLTKVSFAAIMIGFTSSSTFMLWLNCNQELGRSYGMTDSSAIQSFYALGTATAILATTFLIKKGLKEINVLILYPAISTVMLGLCFLIQAPWICLVGGFVIGYAGAGGVLQLATSTTAEFFPENKGTATSMVMIASSIANYTIISLASYITKVGGASAPRMILLLNMGVTVVGILLALYVKKNRDK